MKYKIRVTTFFLQLFWLFNHAAHSQKLPPLPAALESLKPVDIFPNDAASRYTFNDGNKASKPSLFGANAQDNQPVFTTEVFAPTKSHYQVQASWESGLPVKKGDVLLARLAVRAVYAKQESGEAVINFFVQQTQPPHEKSVIIELSIGPEWKTVDIPFVAAADMPARQATICISYGALAQKVEVAGIQVLNFEQRIALPQLPTTRFTYAGREANAAWRTAARKRIEEIRTAPLTIQVTDAKGRPVPGATVRARLVQPEFVFGTAVSVKDINATDPSAVTYKKTLKELFNTVVIGNGLKWEPWRDTARRRQTKLAIDWIQGNGFRLRGHNLVWPGKQFTPTVFKQQPNFGPGFADSIRAHIRNIVSYTKGKVIAWDVINEMVHEKDYFAVMPRTEAAEWFKLAKSIDSKPQLFLNEYGMLNSVASPRNIKDYLALLAELRTAGAPIDAIGIQGHVGRQPRNPAQVLTDLDMFKDVGLPIQITEFDINMKDEELQADYTRDFLIACYSHPSVTGFTMWGFWEGDHWKPDAAMFRKDWTPKPNLAAWRNLVTKEWNTSVNQTTGPTGAVKARGHLGRYEISVKKGSIVKKVVYQLTKAGAPVKVKI
ncbi:endo-1,4-beta-xylanase [Hymenobacter terrenus]|uniref:endo-1,4-beta-xylanase n=1 Tax=Hymenobacter terrenus TaxID=1629124 RepID=UPI0006191859|nr:endo-1,4-beta-xylanase [Hymenobacter terrenus]